MRDYTDEEIIKVINAWDLGEYDDIKELQDDELTRLYENLNENYDEISENEFFEYLSAKLPIATIVRLAEEAKGENREFINSDIIVHIWKKNKPEIQMEYMFSMINLLLYDLDRFVDIWEATDYSIQDNCLEDVFYEIKALDESLCASIWRKTNFEVQQKHPELLQSVIEYSGDNPEMLIRTWMYSAPELLENQPDMLQKTIKIATENQWEFLTLWESSDSKCKNRNGDFFSGVFENLVKQGSSLCVDIWRETPIELQKSVMPNLIKYAEGKPKEFASIWRSSEPEVKQKNSIRLLDELLPFTREWKSLDEELLKIILPYLLIRVKNNFNYVDEIVCSMSLNSRSQKIMMETYPDIIKVAKSDLKLLSEIWKETDDKVQNRYILDVVKEYDKEPELLASIWGGTKRQKDNIGVLLGIIEQDKYNPELLKSFWSNTRDSVKLKEFLVIAQKINDDVGHDEYVSFVKNYLGDSVEFSDDGTVLLPEELEKSIFNNSLYIDDTELAFGINKNIQLIVQKWDNIKEYIQLQKANEDIKENGLEIRATSIKNILNAAQAISKPEPQTASAREYVDTKGSEAIGVDLKFTLSPSTAVQRAYTLAEKMDYAGSVKKYPDFSISSKYGIYLHVLHPQDKSAINFGFDTSCCFRPNGNADSKGQSEYSLLQYCITTKYGGVLRCESMDGESIYMGTPFLVNGNMMIFHSFESESEERKRECNDFLVDGAVNAIEQSNGSIDVVLMADVHEKRLDTYGKIQLGEQVEQKQFSFFVPYFEGEEYEKYKDMYTNLEFPNYILAARVGEKVLSGKELLNWYKEVCHGNPQELISRLNLHTGEINQEFDFGAREIKQSITIKEVDTVQELYRKIGELEKQRDILSLILQRKKIHRREFNTNKEQEELEIIEPKLTEIANAELIREVSSYSIVELREKIRQNQEKQLALYSGEDIETILDCKGINLQDEFEKIYTEEIGKKKVGKSQEAKVGRAIGQLISRVREKKDEIQNFSEIMNKIKQKTITDEELKMLEQSGINVTEYRNCINSEQNQEKSSENESVLSESDFKGRVAKAVELAMKDSVKKESAAAGILFDEITDEEMQSKANQEFVMLLRNKMLKSYLERDSYYGKIAPWMINNVSREMKSRGVDALFYAILTDSLTEEQIQIIRQCEEDYEGVNIIEIYNQILGEEDRETKEEKLKKKIRHDKMTKLKGQITIDIEMYKKIQSITGRINGSVSIESCAKLVYGNSWYIAIDKNGEIISSCYNTELDNEGAEKETYESSLQEFQIAQEQESQKIDVDQIGIATKDVTEEEKKAELDALKKSRGGNIIVRKDCEI